MAISPTYMVYGFFSKVSHFWPDKNTQTKRILWKTLKELLNALLSFEIGCFYFKLLADKDWDWNTSCMHAWPSSGKQTLTHYYLPTCSCTCSLCQTLIHPGQFSFFSFVLNNVIYFTKCPLAIFVLKFIAIVHFVVCR